MPDILADAVVDDFIGSKAIPPCKAVLERTYDLSFTSEPSCSFADVRREVRLEGIANVEWDANVAERTLDIGNVILESVTVKDEESVLR